MNKNSFIGEGIFPEHSKWEKCVSREIKKPESPDIRDTFTRDYHRILHSNAYARLKHKTQVFFATRHDHICTRIEHVNHVASVANALANFMGLNSELTNAIATGHDIGHTPFGHTGESIIAGITKRDLGYEFWHERNSLRFVDKVVTLENAEGYESNLNLTYGVRDGIISHCGEEEQQVIFPRQEFVDLNEIDYHRRLSPFTWEGCVVKFSDTISYLGRDIEDAISLKILSEKQQDELRRLVKSEININLEHINNSALIHNFVMDISMTSSPQSGIRFSDKYFHLIRKVKEFNYNYIYYHERLRLTARYAELIIHSIYDHLRTYYRNRQTGELLLEIKEIYPTLGHAFAKWLWKYSDWNDRGGEDNRYRNQVLYRLETEADYLQAVIDFIAGMTDHFAIKIFSEMTSF